MSSDHPVLDLGEATLPAQSTAPAVAGSRDAVLAIGKGSVVGHYVVLEELGRGAMGAVYAAFDPRLERRVALKLLLDPTRGEAAVARMHREAQSLARLSHPNVVAVHDVGEHDGRVFLAMELVDGQPLSTWQRDEPRPWKEILAVYQQAARGLAAAHAQGVVHRDFKPDNVMLGKDGRVRVMDFGLAREGESFAEGPPSGQSGASTLTRTGALMGTPAYMSPEQFGGSDVGPSSDQFSFCVSLYQGLVGERPFAGQSVQELAASTLEGRIREPARRGAAPGWLVTVIKRGLSVDPADRFASMDALLEAIDRGLGSTRRRIGAVVLVGLVGAAGVATLWPEPPNACQLEADAMHATWGQPQGEQLAAAFEATGHPEAATSWQRAATKIDEFVVDWSERNDQVCGLWENQVPVDVLELRRSCLGIQRKHLEGLLDAFATPTAETVGFVLAATAALPDPQACADIDSAKDAPPAEWAEQVTQAQVLLARASVRREVGDRKGAMELAEQSLASLAGIEARRTRAEVLALQASLMFFEGKIDLAESKHLEARRLAARVGDAQLESKLWLDHVTNLNFHRGEDLDRQEHLLEAAELAVLGAGEPAEQVARLMVMRGLIAMDRGDFEGATRHMDEGIELARGTDTGAGALASYFDMRGQVTMQRGEHRAASGYMLQAIAVVEDAYGPAHPSLITYRGNLGVTLSYQGNAAGAREQYLAVAAMLDAAGDTVSTSRAYNLAHLAALEFDDGRPELAARYARRSIEVWKELGAEDTVPAAQVWNTLFRYEYDSDRFDEALSYAQRAQNIYETTMPPAHPTSVQGLGAVSEALLGLGHTERAGAALERQLEVREAALGPNHEQVGITLLRQAEFLETTGDAAKAVAPALRALEILSGGDGRPSLLAGARFVAARALWDADLDRPRALELGRRAIADYRALGEAMSGQRKAAEAWLVAHAEQPALDPGN